MKGRQLAHRVPPKGEASTSGTRTSPWRLVVSSFAGFTLSSGTVDDFPLNTVSLE